MINAKPTQLRLRDLNGTTIFPQYCNWYLRVRVCWDTSQFTKDDVARILSIAGEKFGLGWGRVGDPRVSLGFGRFKAKYIGEAK